MNQKIESDGAILNQLDRQARMLVTLKNKAYASLVLAESAEADARGGMAAYKSLATNRMYSELAHLDLYSEGNKFWIHEGPDEGEYIFQDQVIIDADFDWRVVADKVAMTSKGKPSKSTIRMHFMVDHLAAHGKKTPRNIVGA
jgi:hypothetical protein